MKLNEAHGPLAGLFLNNRLHLYVIDCQYYVYYGYSSVFWKVLHRISYFCGQNIEFHE